jgi:dCTP deaminase
MVVLTKPDIVRLISEGEIVCKPEGKINPNSIDVSLSSAFFRQEETYDPVIPYSPEIVGESCTPVWCSEVGKLTNYRGKQYISIDAGETILATTNQFIGARGRYTTMLKAKSTTGRLGLDVCGSAGWGDPGYIDRWAFPLRNNGTRTVLLLPGTWIAQIVFFEVSTPDCSYSQVGSYQSSDDIDTLMREWTPQSVLPKFMKA